MQQSHLRYVVEFDIKGFFDNVDHSKLIKQMWALGIRDKRQIYIIKRILKAPIQLENGTTMTPVNGYAAGRYYLAIAGKYRAERTGLVGGQPVAKSSGGCGQREKQTDKRAHCI